MTLTDWTTSDLLIFAYVIKNLGSGNWKDVSTELQSFAGSILSVPMNLITPQSCREIYDSIKGYARNHAGGADPLVTHFTQRRIAELQHRIEVRSESIRLLQDEIAAKLREPPINAGVGEGLSAEGDVVAGSSPGSPKGSPGGEAAPAPASKFTIALAAHPKAELQQHVSNTLFLDRAGILDDRAGSAGAGAGSGAAISVGASGGAAASAGLRGAAAGYPSAAPGKKSAHHAAPAVPPSAGAGAGGRMSTRSSPKRRTSTSPLPVRESKRLRGR